MKLPFTKMNGLGNDFMVVEWPAGRPPPDADLIRRWADRRPRGRLRPAAAHHG
jgi:diaminopimelate epimerase